MVENFELDLKKILVINLAGMGDLVMSTPALRALRNIFPQAYIGILVLSENKDLLIHCPYINEIFELKSLRSLKNIFGNISIINRLRSHRFDLAVNLYSIFSKMGALKIFALLSLIRPQKSLGRDTDKKGFFYDFKIEDYFYSDRHQVERILDLIGFLDTDEKNKDLEVWTSEESERHISSFLEKNAITNSDIIIGINPGSRRVSHRWPVENFAKLVQLLTKIQNVRIVITGSKSEIELAKKITRLSGVPLVISSEEFSIPELVAFIKRCDIFITNDTGPMHIANALRKNLIVLIGGGSISTLPYCRENCIILRKDISCSPCYKSKCKKLDCLRLITPDEVLESVKKYI